MAYRLAIQIEEGCIAWAVVNLRDSKPYSIVRAGVRVFSTGRNPKTGVPLAEDRRVARSARRRLDRMQSRRDRLVKLLIEYGFFPPERDLRKNLERLNPYELRARGLDHPLSPSEFARAVFHINKRRGFKSNRRLQSRDDVGGARNDAIRRLRYSLTNGEARTVGEYLYKKALQQDPVRVRQRVPRSVTNASTTHNHQWFVDRSMIADEFDNLWKVQARFNQVLFKQEAYVAIKDTIFFQRRWKSPFNRYCSLMPESTVAHNALPSVQLLKIYQCVNRLTIVTTEGKRPLNDVERSTLVKHLGRTRRLSIIRASLLLELENGSYLADEDADTQYLYGNATADAWLKVPSLAEFWQELPLDLQDKVTQTIVSDETDETLIKWLTVELNLELEAAEEVARLKMPRGLSTYSLKATKLLLAYMRDEGVTLEVAISTLGFAIPDRPINTIKLQKHETLPYYGMILHDHLNYGTNNPQDCDEIRYGRIGNPSVHISLNQLRLIINALIADYGIPSEISLSFSKATSSKSIDHKIALTNHAVYKPLHATSETSSHQVVRGCELPGITFERLRLWEELHSDPKERRCPFSGVLITPQMLASESIVITHILPFSETLDNSFENKTICSKQADYIKSDRSPYDAFGIESIDGYNYDDIMDRSARLPLAKYVRFKKDAISHFRCVSQNHLEDYGKQLNYPNRVYLEYLTGVVGQLVKTVPPNLVSNLRSLILNNDYVANLPNISDTDYRTYVTDACILAAVDLHTVKKASAAFINSNQARMGLSSLFLPWPTFCDHLSRVLRSVKASHRPDHCYKGKLHNETAYKPSSEGFAANNTNMVDGHQKVGRKIKLIPMSKTSDPFRHSKNQAFVNVNYKGYPSMSNYCIDIIAKDTETWIGKVMTTFEAYDLGRRAQTAETALASPQNLVMRLHINDCITIRNEVGSQCLRVIRISDRVITFVDVNQRYPQASWAGKAPIISKTPGALRKAGAIAITTDVLGRISRAKRGPPRNLALNAAGSTH